MTNAVVDRVDFSRAKLKGAKFVNAVVTGAAQAKRGAGQQGKIHHTPLQNSDIPQHVLPLCQMVWAFQRMFGGSGFSIRLWCRLAPMRPEAC